MDRITVKRSEMIGSYSGDAKRRNNEAALVVEEGEMIGSYDGDELKRREELLREELLKNDGKGIIVYSSPL